MKELNLPEDAGTSSTETKIELVESCWSKDQLLTMADLGNWTSEFYLKIYPFNYVVFKDDISDDDTADTWSIMDNNEASTKKQGKRPMKRKRKK